MTACNDLADYHWLTGDGARQLLDELAVDPAPLHTAVARLRGQLSATRTHLLIEQVELRRRAAVKFSRALHMFFTRVGLEQATDEWVAAYKAAKLVQRVGASAPPAVADLCCGIGGDLLGHNAQDSAVGVERDPIAAHFATVNSGAEVHNTDANEFGIESVAAWHIDPDRRPAGQRTTTLAFYEPNLDSLEQLIARAPNAAIKLAPATDVPPHWPERCEFEWISRARQCRQLVAWHGELAHHTGKCCATVLPSACGLAPRTITGTPNLPVPITPAPARYLFDPDPAVRAAKLQGALAAEHNLSALAHGPTYLTGPAPLDDHALACFEVIDTLPLRTNQLARYLRERAIGRLEVKTRGVRLDPDKLRRDLKPRGDNTATLLITPVASRPTAIIAHRYSAHPSSAKIDRSF